ncbi:MAG: DUF2283 domain-containing protein [Actinomycetota bacterium]
MSIELSIDQSANSAYIRLLNEVVKYSRTIGDDIVIDLNSMNIVIGIEILDLEAEIPFTELTTEFHVHSNTVELLRKLRPSISGFMSMFSSDVTDQASSRVGSSSSR